MKKLWFLGALAVMAAFGSSLQAEEGKKAPEYGWKKQLVGTLNISQTSLDNWVQGGENTFAWQLDVLGHFEEDREVFNWNNTAKLSYGMSKIGEAEPRKSVDEIRFESVYRRKLGWFVDPYAAFRVESQLTKGYTYSDAGKVAVSDFWDPAYLVESAGLGFQPASFVKSRLGIAFKQTMTRNFAPLYADNPATAKIEKVRSEVGVESVSDFNKKLAENMLYTGKLQLFSNLKGIRAVDVRWDNLLTAKVTKIVSVTLDFRLFYDRDVSKKRQIRQALLVGLTYSFL
ncbi:MAG TPA: DUF3078 domain-containing protein [Bacteroidetes bacterium]|nr:DUF3078 domain-containing protein [Bacteroidota bacterium]